METKHLKKRHREQFSSLGMSPGELVDYDTDDTKEAQIHLTCYNADKFGRKAIVSTENLNQLTQNSDVNWIQVTGYDLSVIESLGKQFDIHPLILEDINERQERPKIQSTPGYCFITMSIYSFNEQLGSTYQERFSLLLFDNTLITFHENDSTYIQSLLSRLEQNLDHARVNRADYLAYRLLDCVVDQIFNTLQILGDKVDALEADMSNQEQDHTLTFIHHIKHQLILMRRGIWPLREIFGSLVRDGDEYNHFSDSCIPFLRDLHDHALQAAEINESLRDETMSLLDLYLNSIANNMNQVMKTLSIIGTIFLPLTFITSLYGMNFTYMPELKNHYAYPIVMAIMLGIAGVMLYFFKKKKWF